MADTERMIRLTLPIVLLPLVAASTSCSSGGGSRSHSLSGVPSYEWRDLEWKVSKTIEAKHEGRDLRLVRYSPPYMMDGRTDYGLLEGGQPACDVRGMRAKACEVIDAATGEVLLEKRLQDIRFLPGTGFLALEKERWMSNERAEELCSRDPSALNYQHLDVFTGALSPSNIKWLANHETRPDGRSSWPDRDPSSIDKYGAVRTFRVEIEERSTPAQGEGTRHLQFRELNGRILADLPAVYGEPVKLGDFLAYESELGGERRIALMSWCHSNLHWAPAGTKLFRFDGGGVYDDIYRLSAPVPETDEDDDLWLFLTDEGGFSAPDDVVGFTPVRCAPRTVANPSLIVECEWVWLVRYPVSNERDPLARRWGLLKTFKGETTPPIWTHYQTLHSQRAVDVASQSTPQDERDAFGYACKTESFIALQDVDEHWHLVDSNPRIDLLKDRQTRANAYRPGSSGDFERIDGVLNRWRAIDRKRVDRAQLRKAVKGRDGQSIERWAIRVGDNSVFDQVRITFPDASQEMLAAAISALTANGCTSEADELRVQFNETEAFIARVRAAKAQREALFAQLAAEEKARTEARRRSHALTLRQPNSSASWSGGSLPRWTPSESQKMEIFRHNLDVQIQSVLR